MEGRKIVWDQDKAAENLKKHHVSFDTAALVFLDPSRIERRDDSENNTSAEDRWQTLGVVGKVFFVVYTECVNEAETRIITARAASKAEKRSYYGNDERNIKGWTKAD
ncbi:MAG: BrnT family toxin [Spirochaetales bacterium]|nr:BrnT family toxin [Spirochaetales bacterium]